LPRKIAVFRQIVVSTEPGHVSRSEMASVNAKALEVTLAEIVPSSFARLRRFAHEASE
jgi:hypothetical protein